MTQDQRPTDQEKHSSTEDQADLDNHSKTSHPAEQVIQQSAVLDENHPTNKIDLNQYNQNSTVVDPSQQDQADAKNPIVKVMITVLIIALLGLITFGLWKAYQPQQLELQGRVEAETIHISTKVPSRIEDIYIHDGQTVKKGQELVRLFSPEVDAKKQQALASLQSALALQSTAERGSQQENIESLYANWQSLKAQQVLAETTYHRGANLFKEGVISRQRRDEMQAAAFSAKEMATSAYQQYARAQRGSTPQQKSSADAQVQIAQAAVDEANALLAETKLLSPINGTVSKVYGKPSELVATGVPVVSIIQDEDISVSLNIREDQYAQVYQAKTMQGFIPALKQSAEFKLEHIDAEGEFATIKTTRQTGGYDVRSFKVKLIPAQKIVDLKVGMSVLFKVEESN